VTVIIVCRCLKTILEQTNNDSSDVSSHDIDKHVYKKQSMKETFLDDFTRSQNMLFKAWVNISYSRIYDQMETSIRTENTTDRELNVSRENAGKRRTRERDESIATAIETALMGAVDKNLEYDDISDENIHVRVETSRKEKSNNRDVVRLTDYDEADRCMNKKVSDVLKRLTSHSKVSSAKFRLELLLLLLLCLSFITYMYEMKLKLTFRAWRDAIIAVLRRIEVAVDPTISRRNSRTDESRAVFEDPGCKRNDVADNICVEGSVESDSIDQSSDTASDAADEVDVTSSFQDPHSIGVPTENEKNSSQAGQLVMTDETTTSEV